MISKKKLRERILDICEGAGMHWLEDDMYFEHHDAELACTGRLIAALERAFDLCDDSPLRSPWNLERMDEIDKLVELVHDVISLAEANR